MTTTATMAQGAQGIDTQAPPSSSPAGPVKLARSLVDAACAGDQGALQTILRQFIDVDERIDFCEYLGTLGLPPFGEKSFAVLTPRRVGSLRIGWFGQVLYQDAPLEYTVSGVVAQPSKLSLYLALATVTALLLAVEGAGALAVGPWSARGIALLLVTPAVLAGAWLLVIRLHHRLRKCGLVWAIREGIWVYAFTDRGRMNVANRLHRRIFEARERRVREVQAVP